MGRSESSLTLRHVPHPGDDIMALLERAHAHDTTGGMVHPADYLGALPGEFFAVEIDGRLRAAYVLCVNHWAHGAEGVVAYAGGDGPDLTGQVLPLIEQQFAGVRAVRIETRRRGLIRKLTAQGYRVDGVILRKNLHHES